MNPPRLLVEVPSDRSPRLAVQLLQPVKATNGQEFDAGMVAGFTPRSAVAMVKAGVGRAWLHHDTQRDWAQALGGAGVSAEKSLQMIAGPFALELAAMQASFEAQRAAAADVVVVPALPTDDELEQTRMEIERAARQAEFDAQQVPAIPAVSMADVPTEKLHDPEPAPAPAPPPSTSKRGSKSPRG